MRFTPRRLKRYRQIIEVLARHGFGAALAQLDLDYQLRLPGLLNRWQRPANGLTAAEHLREAMEELGPTFIKFGQLLSTRPDLVPPAYVEELRHLQDRVPPVPWSAIGVSLEMELGGPTGQFFSTIDPVPLAAASLGQVHAARLLNGQEVVVKVQRPDILTQIEVDLDILYDLARLAQNTQIGKIYNLTEVAKDFAVLLRSELNYRREARNADQFRANFAREPHMYVPHIYWDFTTERVLVMEYLSGIKVDDVDALDAAGYDRRAVAHHSARMILKEILVDGFFHADPHPGNLVVMPGEVIGLMDFGQVGYLEPGDRADLMRLYLLIVQGDTLGIVEHLIHMGVASYRVDRNALQQDIRRLLQKHQGLPLKDIRVAEIMEDITRMAAQYRLRVPGNILALFRVVAMMQGIGFKLDPDFDILTLSARYARRFQTRLWQPEEWGPTALRSTIDWATLLSRLPRQTAQLLEQAERGQAGLQIYLPDLPDAVGHLDRIANRLALSILMAAFVMALALLIPILNLTWPWGWLTWTVIAAFAIAVFLAVWLLWSMWRANR